MEDKLAIVGSEESTRDNAPWTDLSYDIWTFADWGKAPWLERCTALIEIHRPIGQSGYTEHPRDPYYWEWLQNTDTPVFMYPPDPRVKSSVNYPLDGVLAMLEGLKIKGQNAKPLNCSPAYAIALGIYKGYTEIDVYGIEMAHSSIYQAQQPIFSFWVGFAAGKGVKLNIKCTNDLFIKPLYGIEQSFNFERIRELIEATEKQRTLALNTVQATSGALQVLNKLLLEE